MQLDMLVLFIESTADQPTLNIAWPLIGQHKLTAQTYRDWSTVKTYSSTTVQSTVHAPLVSTKNDIASSILLGSKHVRKGGDLHFQY